MTVQRLKTDIEKSYEALPSYDAEAYAAFEAQGLPHRRVEAYKYTDLRNLLQKAPAPIQQNVAARFNEKMTGLGEDDPIALMNAAFCESATRLVVTKDEVLTLEQGDKSFSRLFIEVAEGVTFTLILKEKMDGVQTNNLIHVTLQKNTKFDHYYVQNGNQSQILNTFVVKAEANAEFRAFTLNEGVALARNQYFITLNGDDCKVNLSGIALQNGQLHTDTTLQIQHIGLRGESRECFKYVLANGAKGVFQGKIIVQKDAQKTDGKMSSNAIMLDDDCEMMNKPELEIYADDVVCGHGATVGQLDEDLLFYMQARGLPPFEAKALLLQAFCGEALENIENEAQKEYFSTRMIAALKAFD